MAFYSALEVNEILKKLSQEPASEVKFLKFERLGILVDPEDESSLTKKEQDDENATQLYACSVCSKKLISAHLLDLHVTENHDSYFELQKDKKPMYACYLEECKLMSASPHDRKDHCIKTHKFPHDFRFDKVPSKKKLPGNEMMDTAETTANPSSATSKLMNFHFGHKSQKTFKSRYNKPDPLESMAVDMKESLPDI